VSWIDQENLRKRFWATVHDKDFSTRGGATDEEVHDALKVDSVTQYMYGLDQALEEVRAYKEGNVSEFTEARFTGIWKGDYKGGELFICIRDNKDSDGMTRLEAQIPSTTDAPLFDEQPDMGPTQAAAQPDMGPPLEERRDWCAVHEAKMEQKISKKTKKPYWVHWSKAEGGNPCFGQGWQE